MESPAYEESYEEAKRKAKEFYEKIGSIWCPALNEYVIFNRAGLRHLMQKGPAFRPKSEQKRRFALISHAKRVIENAAFSSSYSKERDAQFWVFIEKCGGLKINIVVRQIGNGRKHFLSVYCKQQKSAL